MITIRLPENAEQAIMKGVISARGKITRAVSDAINDGLFEIESRAKAYAPVDTGRLRSSIHTVPVGKGGEEFFKYTDNEGHAYDGALMSAREAAGQDIGFVGTNVEYAEEQEFGGSGKRGHKYLSRATAELIRPITDEINRVRV